METPYAEQLKRKQAEAMRQLGALGPVRPILGMKEPLHYRHKVIASFAQDARGVLYAGLYAQGSHHVVPVEDCALQDTRANALLRTVVMLAKECKWHAYEEDRREGLLRHVLIRTSWKRPEAMVTLVTSQPTLPGGKYFAARLRTLCPEVQTLTQSVNARATSVVLGAQPRVLYGPGFIEDALCGMTFRLSPTAFYQVNPAQAEVLYKQAAAFA
ncbi:MAG: 23S rRNA (uracil(1939)-C(5))-methyltransferase RlmD, partial [Ruthenibacterium sp.]